MGQGVRPRGRPTAKALAIVAHGFFRQGLFKTIYACIACDRNDAVGTRMTMKQYLAAHHVVVRPDGRAHLLDRFLDDKGWQRNIALELSHFISLLAILPGSDLVATVPLDIATVLERHVPIKRIDLPFKPPQIDVQQFWHRRMQNDGASKWLRAVFHAVNRREPNQELGS